MTKTMTKTFDASLVKSPTDGRGIFVALVSTYGGKPDSQGDIIDRGAFTKTILEWKTRGRPIVLHWQHRFEDPDAAIGVVTELRDSPEGLIAEGRLDLATSELAVKIYEKLLAETIGEFSIGYAVPAGGEYKGADGFNHIREIEILEISIVGLGANANTRLLSIKSAEATAEEATKADMAARLEAHFQQLDLNQYDARLAAAVNKSKTASLQKAVNAAAYSEFKAKAQEARTADYWRDVLAGKRNHLTPKEQAAAAGVALIRKLDAELEAEAKKRAAEARAAYDEMILWMPLEREQVVVGPRGNIIVDESEGAAKEKERIRVERERLALEAAERDKTRARVAAAEEAARAAAPREHGGDK